MMKSESGAGQVGLLTVIFLIVLVLGLAGLCYVAFKEKADLESQMAAIEAKEKAAFDKFNEVNEQIMEISRNVGYRDSDTAPSSLDAIKDTIMICKEKYPEFITGDADTLDDIIDGIQAACTDVTTKLDESKRNFVRETEVRAQAEENINTIQGEMNRRVSELEAQLSDEQQRSQSQMDEDNQRISNLQAQLDEAEQRVREAENNAESVKAQCDKEINMLTARVNAQAKKLEVLREPDQPDGKVMSSSSQSGLAFIDIGRMDGLRRGTKFDVFRQVKGGAMVSKGMIEVLDVDMNSAKCGVIGEVDELDPIVKGDVIVNPHFARNMKRNFVFLGEFPAFMSKEFVKSRLQELGADVQEKIDSDSDFLVLGQKEKGEYSQELTDLPEFKLATKMGVQVLRLKDLAAYIEY